MMEQLAFDKIRQTVVDSMKAGEPIDHKSFIDWLDGLARNDQGLREYRLMKHEADMAFYNAKMDSRQSRYRQKLEVHRSMFEAVMTTAISALKTSWLLNGGASIAMLGFLAALLKDNHALVLANEYKYSLVCFSAGAAVAAFATATTYFAQYYFQIKVKGVGEAFRLTSIALVLISYVFFGYGIWDAYLGLN